MSPRRHSFERRTTAVLSFQGRRDFAIERGKDEWGYSPEEQETQIELFRRELAAAGAWSEDKHDFFTLRRFLRARNYDIHKAKEMWLAHQHWRTAENADTVMQDFVFHEDPEVIKYFPQGYHKADKLGRPIYVQRCVGMDPHRLTKVTTEDRMFRSHIQEYERLLHVVMPLMSRLHGHHVDTTFNIIDLEGASLWMFTKEARSLFARVAKADQDNYPEMLGHVCVLNAPAIFRVIWGFAKTFLDQRTQGKVEVLGSDYKQALLKWVHPDNLMTVFGGNSPGKVGENVGPWTDPHNFKRVGLCLEDLERGVAPPPLQPGCSQPLEADRMESPTEPLQLRLPGLEMQQPSWEDKSAAVSPSRLHATSLLPFVADATCIVDEAGTSAPAAADAAQCSGSTSGCNGDSLGPHTPLRCNSQVGLGLGVHRKGDSHSSGSSSPALTLMQRLQQAEALITKRVQLLQQDQPEGKAGVGAAALILPPQSHGDAVHGAFASCHGEACRQARHEPHACSSMRVLACMPVGEGSMLQRMEVIEQALAMLLQYEQQALLEGCVRADELLADKVAALAACGDGAIGAQLAPARAPSRSVPVAPLTSSMAMRPSLEVCAGRPEQQPLLLSKSRSVQQLVTEPLLSASTSYVDVDVDAERGNRGLQDTGRHPLAESLASQTVPSSSSGLAGEASRSAMLTMSAKTQAKGDHSIGSLPIAPQPGCSCSIM